MADTQSLRTFMPGGRAMKVALFVTCVNDTMFPETGRAVVTLLRRLGVEVDFPAGRPAAASRWSTPATSTRRCRWSGNCVTAFEGYDAVVTPSGSCAGSVRHQHGIVRPAGR